MKVNWLLLVVLAVALFVRVYRVDQLLGFYYDQGRDAKVIWNLWHQGRFFLIGPTTGVEGIFLGPFYYYFIAPAYLLGQGNPVWPAVWVAVINVAGIGLVCLLGQRYFDQATGLLAAGMAAVSFYLMLVQRWLANPAPLPFFALIVVWSLLEIVHGRGKWWSWVGVGLGIGLSLQFEAASATFFLPATGLILFLFRRQINWRWLALAGVAFLATLLPQLVFDYRHQHLLLHAFQNFLVADRSFRPEISSRLSFYYEVFVNKFVPNLGVGKYFAITVAVLAVINLKKLRSKSVQVLLVWWLTPVVGLLFYHGNHGYVWDYYFTGVYPALILLVAWVLVTTWKRTLLAKIIVLVLLGIFFWQNVPRILGYIKSGVDGSTTVALGSEKQAVDWVYHDSGGAIFNVDAYVPPVITHSYDYLFLWIGSTKYRSLPELERIPLLYTLYEVDPPHPERLQAWLNRQAGIGQVEKSATFGGITVERRTRLRP